jgi:phage terminase small subunit
MKNALTVASFKPRSTSRPPAHLPKSTRAWWSAVCAKYILEEHHKRILTLACESWDLNIQAREILEREGLQHQTHSAPRLHPMCKVVYDSLEAKTASASA